MKRVALLAALDYLPQWLHHQMLLTEQGVQAASDQGKGTHHLLASFMNGNPPSAGPFVMPNAVTLEELRLAEAQPVRAQAGPLQRQRDHRRVSEEVLAD